MREKRERKKKLLGCERAEYTTSCVVEWVALSAHTRCFTVLKKTPLNSVEKRGKKGQKKKKRDGVLMQCFIENKNSEKTKAAHLTSGEENGGQKKPQRSCAT